MFEVDPKKSQNSGIPRKPVILRIFCSLYILTNMATNFLVFGKGLFTKYVDNLLAFFDRLSSYVDIFYLLNVDKKSTFLDYLLT